MKNKALPAAGAPATQSDASRVRGNKYGFLAAIAVVGTITGAAAAANVNRGTHYKWISPERDPEGVYAKAFEDATEQFRDTVRQEVRRRAIDGVRRPIMYQGAQVLQAVIDPETGLPRLHPVTGQPEAEPMWLVEYSDRMLELLAKATCPEFRDKIAVTGEGGGPVKVLTVHYPVPFQDAAAWTAHYKPTVVPEEDEDDEQLSEQESEAARLAKMSEANVRKAEQAARDRIV